MSRLDATLGIITTPFRKGLAEAKASVDSFTSGASNGISNWAAGIGAAGMAYQVKAIISEFARVQDLADRFNMSAESVQRLGAAAGQSGTDIETLAKALQKGNAAAQEAATGGGGAAQAFERLGLNAKIFAQLDQQGQLMALADAFAAASDKNRAMADITKILGKSAGELIPLLKEGAAGIRALGDAAGVATDEQVRMLAATDDLLDAMGKRGKTILGQFTAYVAGGVAGLWEMFKSNDEATKKLLGGDVSGAWQMQMDSLARPWEDALKRQEDAQAEMENKRVAAAREAADAERRAAQETEEIERQKRVAYEVTNRERVAEVAAAVREIHQKEQEALAERQHDEFEAELRRDERFRKRLQDDVLSGLRGQQGDLSSRAEALAGVIGRLTQSDSLQAIGGGFRGVNYGANRTVERLDRMRRDVVAQLVKVEAAIRQMEVRLKEDEF